MAVEKNIIVHSTLNAKNKSNKQRFLALLFVSMFVFFLFENQLEAQMRIDFGPLAGTSYYMGDLNPGVPFSGAGPSFGGLARYVISDRLALKGTVSYGEISGDYDQRKVGVLPVLGKVNGKAGKFKRSILSLDFTGEINLFSYDHKYIASSVFTPYLLFGIGGVGYTRQVLEQIQVPGNPPSQKDTIVHKPHFALALPMGIGVKYKFNKRLRIGAEWTFYKTFVDDLDNYISVGNAVTHNNDWFSVFKIYITFGFFRRKSECFGMCTRTIEDRRKK